MKLIEVKRRVAELDEMAVGPIRDVATLQFVHEFLVEIARGMNQYHAAKIAKILLGREA